MNEGWAWCIALAASLAATLYMLIVHLTGGTLWF